MSEFWKTSFWLAIALKKSTYVFDWLHCSTLQTLDSLLDLLIAFAFVWGYLAHYLVFFLFYLVAPYNRAWADIRDSMTDEIGAIVYRGKI